MSEIQQAFIPCFTATYSHLALDPEAYPQYGRTYLQAGTTYPQLIHRCLQTFHWSSRVTVLDYSSTDRRSTFTGNGKHQRSLYRKTMPGRGRRGKGGLRVTGSFFGSIVKLPRERNKKAGDPVHCSRRSTRMVVDVARRRKITAQEPWLEKSPETSG